MTAYKNTLIFSAVSLILLLAVFAASSVTEADTADSGLLSVTVFGKEETDSLLISCGGETIVICDDKEIDGLILSLKHRNIKKIDRIILTRSDGVSEDSILNYSRYGSVEYIGQKETNGSVGKADISVCKKDDDTIVSVNHGKNLILIVFGSIPNKSLTEHADFIYLRSDEADMHISDGKNVKLSGKTAVIQSNGSYVRILKDISLI